MKVKLMNKFLRWILRGQYSAITLCPFGIYVKSWNVINPRRTSTLDHETTHWKQQLEMLVVPFYIWYLLEWLIKLLIYGKQAYYEISFEREAYYNDNSHGYNDRRKPYAWLKYIFKTNRRVL